MTTTELKRDFQISVGGKAKTKIIDAAGRTIKETGWQSNLVFDRFLNALAQGTNALPHLADANGGCTIGSNNTSNSIASGAITFTQVATTLTASAGFFTAPMVGTLFKYGVGSAGVEMYITAFTSTTIVTVSVSATVATPTVGTVWLVNQTALGTFLFQSNTYQTSAGSCQTTFAGNQVTMQRTYTFPTQVSTYNVNEIGYFLSLSSGNCFGRVVLAGTDVVNPANTYVVTIAITYTLAPAAPTAVGNIGTGINTAGNAMVEFWNVGTILSTGGFASNSGLLDASSSSRNVLYVVDTYSQQSSIQTVTKVQPATQTFQDALGGLTNTVLAGSSTPSNVSQCTMTKASTFTTAAQSLKGVGMWNATGGTFLVFDVLLTTPVTLPSGTWQPTTTWTWTYGRALVN